MACDAEISVPAAIPSSTAPPDELAEILAAAELPKDQKTDKNAVGFLKSFLSNASTPERSDLSIEDAVRTLQLMELCVSEAEMAKEEFDILASMMLRLLEDPNWNKNTTAELLGQTRQIQGNSEKIRRPVLSDARYGTNIPLVWTDDLTATLLNSSELYLKYHGQHREMSASSISTIMMPYVQLILRLKMIAEEQSQSGKSKRSSKNHGQTAKSVKSGKGKPGVEVGHATLKPSGLPIGTAHDKHITGKRSQHSQLVIDSAVDWLRCSLGIDSCQQQYYKELCLMWTSGQFEWARNQPIPSQSQVYYWLKNSRRDHPPVVNKFVVTKKQLALKASQTFKKLALAFKSREQDYPAGSRGQFGLSKCLDTVLLLCMNDQSYQHVLLLAQTSKWINLRMKRSELYMQVQRIVQGRMVDIDAQLVLAQINSTQCKTAQGSESAIAQPTKQRSSKQIHVDFSKLAISAQENSLRGFKGDFRDTVINLGDSLGIECLEYIGEGGFGTVFSHPETRMAIKIFKRPGLLDQAVRDVANEAACFHLASTLNRMSTRGLVASRNKLFPFAPLPLSQIAGSTSGALALPSWGLGDSIFYPALIMELAIGSINLETRQLSKSFFSDPMGAVSEEGFIRLASVIRFITEPLSAMHALNLAHRDVKEDNILAMRVAPGVNGYIYYSTAGKKWTGRLGDCGKALSFGVEFEPETSLSGPAKGASKRAKNTVAALGGSAHALKHDRQVLHPDEFKPPAEMASKFGTVPLLIPMSVIHLINPVAPSTQKQSDMPVIRRKAPQYSGTMTYTPPEQTPPSQASEQFLTSRDYQAGDMWSLGVVLANMLGGSGLQVRLSMMSSHDKMIFAEAENRVIWIKLNKLPAALDNGSVPDLWTDVMDLLRSLTRKIPHERLTAAEVLEHPFLKRADMLARMYSS
jgi:serine/threonine protein kinase